MMSFGIRLEQTLKKKLGLTQEQRLKIVQSNFALRLQLLGGLRNEQYKPTARCPRCFREMTPIEIISGFNQNPNDFTTKCPICENRFQPKLIYFSDGTELEIPFYCDIQTLSQMRGKEEMTPGMLMKDYPGIYRSAIIHHGSLKNAFRKIGINYDFQEFEDWINKIIPFLGRLPDTVIASSVNTSANTVGSMRRKMGISRFTLRKALDE